MLKVDERYPEFLVLTEESERSISTPVNRNRDVFLLLDSEYDRADNKVKLLFYDTRTRETFYHADNTEFKFRCLTDYTQEELEMVCLNSGRNESFATRRVVVFDRIKYSDVEMTQILASTPAEITSKGYNRTDASSILEPSDTTAPNHAWENHIFSEQRYRFDYDYVPGILYTFKWLDLEFLHAKRCPECGCNEVVVQYGYNRGSPDENIIALNQSCAFCGNNVWRNPGVPPENCINWERIVRKGDLVQYGKRRLRVPVPVNIEIDPAVADILAQKFLGQGPEQMAMLQKWLPYFFARVPDIKRVAMDIEVLQASRRRFPDEQRVETPVCCVCFSDSDGKHTALVLNYYKKRIPPNLIGDDDAIRKHLSDIGVMNIIDENFEHVGNTLFYVDRGTKPLATEFNIPAGDVEIVEFSDEEELLLATFEMIQQYPMLVTFNGDKFDLMYLYNRATKRFQVSPDIIPISVKGHMNPKYGEMEYDCSLRGAVHFDLYKWFSDNSIKIYGYGAKYGDNSLRDIGTALIGRGKVDVELLDEHGDEKFLSHYSMNEMVYYCHVDTLNTLDLTRYDDDVTMKLLVLLMRLSKCGMSNQHRRAISYWIRTMLFHIHVQERYLIPRDRDIRCITESRSLSVIEGKGYKGAVVFDTVPGIHVDVTVMDFASLYPSIIKEYNLSYETVDVCNHPGCKTNGKIPGDVYHWVCQERGIGILSLVVGFIRDIRVFYFKDKAGERDKNGKSTADGKWASVVQSILKVFINGSYGVFGSVNFYFYQVGVGESTTAIGRYNTTHLAEKAENMGIKIDGGDTDSVFLEGITPEQCRELIEWSSNVLKCDLGVDYEWKLLAMSHRKKNYIGFRQGKWSVGEDGKKRYDAGGVDMKGVVGKKKNTPPFLRREFKKVVDFINIRVHRLDHVEDALNVILKRIDALRKLNKNKQIPVKDLVFDVKLNKDPFHGYNTNPQHVKAAKILKKRTGKVLEAGDTVSYIKTIGGPLPIEVVEDTHLVDVKTYESHIETTFSQLLDCFGIDWRRQVVDRGQRTLA